MRAIAAGLFVLVGVLVLFIGIGRLEVVRHMPSTLSNILMCLALVGLVLGAERLFKLDRRSRKQRYQDRIDAHFRQLEEQGLLEWLTLRATRAFGVEEHEDEGSHYFVELDDGRVLYLRGQYLYEYEPITDGSPEENQPRSFPCTEFAVRRHKTEGYVVELICKGTPFEPEVMAPSFGEDVWHEDRTPQDGRLFTDVSYEDLKRQHLSRAHAI